LKIALFTEWFFPVRGGVSSHVYGLAKELTRRKHDVKVFTKRRSRKVPSGAAEYRGITVRTLSPSIPVNFPVIPPSRGQMYEVFSKGDFDLVHSHHAFTPTPLLALGQAHGAGVPSVLTNHSIPGSGYGGTMGDILSSALYPIRQYLNMADHIVAVSRAAADFMSLLVDYVPISVIPNGVDCELFMPRAREHRTGKRILYVSRLVNRKGPHVLIRAFKNVLAEIPDAELVIVGEGYLKPVLEMMRYDLGLGESVKFLGDIGSGALAQTYSSSDVFVLPSLHAESFGMVLLEAMASEVPVIASRTGGVPEVVTDNKEGILVKPGDEEELSEALMRLLTNEGERLEMGKAGRKKAVSEYDWKVVGGKIEDLYRSLA